MICYHDPLYAPRFYLTGEWIGTMRELREALVFVDLRYREVVKISSTPNGSRGMEFAEPPQFTEPCIPQPHRD